MNMEWSPVSIATIVTALCVIVLVILVWQMHCKEGMANDLSSTNIMRNVLLTHSGADQKSTADRVSAAAKQTSQLTGSRDIPVFFQDYDVEMKNVNGTVVNEREGFDGGVQPKELENALKGF
jgi:hypothetical protein